MNELALRRECDEIIHALDFPARGTAAPRDACTT